MIAGLMRGPGLNESQAILCRGWEAEMMVLAEPRERKHNGELTEWAHEVKQIKTNDKKKEGKGTVVSSSIPSIGNGVGLRWGELA